MASPRDGTSRAHPQPLDDFVRVEAAARRPQDRAPLAVNIRDAVRREFQRRVAAHTREASIASSDTVDPLDSISRLENLDQILHDRVELRA